MDNNVVKDTERKQPSILLCGQKVEYDQAMPVGIVRMNPETLHLIEFKSKTVTFVERVG